MLIGNNIALVIYGIYSTEILETPLSLITQNEAFQLFLQTIITTCVILIAGEFIPKSLFRISPNKTLYFFSIPLLIIYYLLYPFVYVVHEISKFILRFVFKVDTTTESVKFGKVELDNFLKEATSNDNLSIPVDSEIKLFHNALTFSEIKLRECIIPRTEIIAVDIDDSISELKESFIKSGKSKIMVYRKNIDNIIGYVHAYELFKMPETIKSVLRPVTIMPETMTADEALEVFIASKRSIAVVVDEFGGTAGILTIEDIMEEIFGEIEDEHDKENFTEIEISKNEYLFSARLEVDYLNQTYKLNIPESEEYETLAGYVIRLFGRIPGLNEVVSDKNYRFKVVEVSGKKIEKLEIKKLRI